MEEMSEVVRQFKIVGHHGMCLIADFPCMRLTPPIGLADMSLDKVIQFKNQIELCNKKHAQVNSYNKPKKSLISFAQEVDKLSGFYGRTGKKP